LAGYGAPHILENKVPRKAVLGDYIKLAKLVHSIGEMSINGGILVQPVDIPADKFQLILLYTTVLFSDKALLGMPGSGRQQAEIMEFLKILGLQ
jgi:trimethylamine--corrinoid protein Co-methyltransferase